MHTELILELFAVQLALFKANELFRVDLLLRLQLRILGQFKELRAVSDLDLMRIGWVVLSAVKHGLAHWLTVVQYIPLT